MPSDLRYVLLLFALLVIPKVLQRLRLPGAITSLLLGVGAAATGWIGHDSTIDLLATFGIVALFLFAGLEVDGASLRRGAGVLGGFVALLAALAAGLALAAAKLLGLDWRAATLVSLAVLTPSTGFILDSLGAFGLDADERFWVKVKAIAVELVALAALFVVLQSTSAARMAVTTLALGALIVLIPLVLRVFARVVAPYAPRSEFAFLLMLAVLCAYATRKLGVYYLVGAFLVGVAARRFRQRLPAMSSDKMLHAIEAFGSVFAPFYFFRAGMNLRPNEFGLAAVGAGLGLLVAAVPLRVGAVLLYRRLAQGGPLGRGLRVGVALVPTLVFTLVLAEILRDQFAAPPWLFGALVIYTVLDTLVPGFVLRGPTPDYAAPALSQEEAAAPVVPAGDAGAEKTELVASAPAVVAGPAERAEAAAGGTPAGEPKQAGSGAPGGA